MDLPADFKFDVRIRDRMLAKKAVSEAEVAKHLEALTDVQSSSELVTLPQPAIGTPESRSVPAARLVAPAVARPVIPQSAPRSIPPTPLPVDAGWGEDDDDDDDDDDEKVEVAKAEVAKAEVAKAEVAKAEVANVAKADVVKAEVVKAEVADVAKADVAEAEVAKPDDEDEDEDEDEDDEDDEDDDDDDDSPAGGDE